MDYINPFGAMGELSSIESPFLRDMERSSRKTMAMPFLELAQQQQEMEMRKKAGEYNEWASPAAQQNRESKQQFETTTNQQGVRRLHAQTDALISTANRQIATDPSATQKEIAEATQLASQARGKPAAELFSRMGAAWEGIKDLDPIQQRGAAKAISEQWQAEHPNMPLPKVMQEFDPVAWRMASLVDGQNRKHLQAMEIEKQKEKASLERQEEMTKRALAVANVQAGSRDRATAARTALGAKPESQDQQRAWAQRVLTNEDADDNLKNNARRILRASPQHIAGATKEVENSFQERANSKGKITEQDIINRYYKRHGLDYAQPSGSLPPEQIKAAVEKEIANNPKWKGQTYDPSRFIYNVDPKTGQVGWALR